MGSTTWRGLEGPACGGIWCVLNDKANKSEMRQGLQYYPEFELFNKSTGEPWEVFEQGRLMFRSICSKDLSGIGAEDGLEECGERSEPREEA